MGTIAEGVKTGIASEGGHWYAPDGTPVYEVPRSKGGGTRPATLRDARKLGLYPGLTGVMRVAAAPGLEKWKQENLLLAAATLPMREGEGIDEWLQRVREDAWKQGEQARQLGTALHKAIEQLLEGSKLSDQGLLELARPAMEWVYTNFSEQPWLVERGFAHPVGYGCRIDFGTRGRRYAIVDFKTTDKPLDQVKLWPEHGMQIAGQIMAVFRNDFHESHLHEVEGWNLFVSTREPGVRALQHKPEDLEVSWRKLLCLVDYWKLDKGYDPSTGFIHADGTL